jgi:hypothetical protein
MAHALESENRAVDIAELRFTRKTVNYQNFQYLQVLII